MKYKYNKYYFDNIDSPIKSYWLGFIMGDGYLMDNCNKNNKSVSTGLRIRLSETDEKQLEKLNESLEYDKPIKIVKNYGIYKNNKSLAEFAIYSKHIVESLKKNGISSGNKSCNECIPENLDPKLIKYFILGLFDADGCISIGNKLTEWSIVSSFQMIQTINDIISKELNIKFNKITKDHKNKDNGLFRLRTLNKKNIEKLYHYFYDDESIINISLERKYNKMKMYKNYSNK